MGGAFALWWHHSQRTFGRLASVRRAPAVWLRLHRMRWPRYGLAEHISILRVLWSRNWGGFPAPNTRARRTGERFSALHDATHFVATSSGTTALQIVFRALNIKAGEEVIVPALTFSSVAGAVAEMGAIPILCDVDAATLCVDPTDVLRKITSRTRAVVAVHLGAQICDLDRLLTVCRESGLALVEDCAHAHGATWRGRGVGSWGDAGCFSFQTNKAMSAGEGGMILTRNPNLAARCRAIVDCGRLDGSDLAPQSVLGGNYRMSEFQAAVLLPQLDRLPKQAKRRARSAQMLDALLGRANGIEILEPLSGVTQRGCYAYAFRFNAATAGLPIDLFLFRLFLRGCLANASLYPPVYDAPEFGRKDPRLTLPDGNACQNTEQAMRDTVWLPHMLLLAGDAEIHRLAADIVSAATPSQKAW